MLKSLPDNAITKIFAKLGQKDRASFARVDQKFSALFKSARPEIVKQDINQINYTVLTLFQLVELASLNLKKSVKDINTSERFETAVLQHALNLDPIICSNIAKTTSVDGNAAFRVKPASKILDLPTRIQIQYYTLSKIQAQQIAKTYNSYYPNIQAEVYTLGQFSEEINFILEVDAEVFCKQVLPVIAAVENQPSKQTDAPLPVIYGRMRC